MRFGIFVVQRDRGAQSRNGLDQLSRLGQPGSPLKFSPGRLRRLDDLRLIACAAAPSRAPSRDSAASSTAIRSNTVFQSPRLSCRNSRTVGYHGESSRSRNQRQSAALGRATQTSTPIVPARWARAVSDVTTRSMFFRIAAVSSKLTPPSALRSSKNCVRGKQSVERRAVGCASRLNAGTARVPSPFCRLTSRTPATAARCGRNSPAGIQRRRSPRYCGFPCQPMPTRNPDKFSNRACQVVMRCGSATMYGTSAGIVSICVPNAPGKLINGR